MIVGMGEILGLRQVSYAVSDVEAAIRFFRDQVGLTFLFSAGPDLAFFDIGGVRLFVERSEKSAGKNSVLYLKVPNVEVAFAEKQGVLDFHDTPHVVAKMPDHELWMVFFRDPDGGLVAFLEERAV